MKEKIIFILGILTGASLLIAGYFAWSFHEIKGSIEQDHNVLKGLIEAIQDGKLTEAIVQQMQNNPLKK